MHLVLTGGAGMLGQDVARLGAAAGHQVTALDRKQLDILDGDGVALTLARLRPDAVVHCAAYTDVDGAEEHEAEALAVNGDGAGSVAMAAAAVGARMVYLSSDYVFAGGDPRPRRETDEIGPQSAYGRSKLAGEQSVAAAGGRWLVVRTAWLYGRGGRNFVDTIRVKAAEGGPLRVVDDQIGSPTWTVSLATGILRLLATDAAQEVVHYANLGAVSWHGLARAIVEQLGLEVEVQAISSLKLGRKAPRPAYSVLDTAKYTKLTGAVPVTWREALALYLDGAEQEPAS